MMTDGKFLSEGVSGSSNSAGNVEDPEWVVVKSLLEVNDACSKTLETVMLYSATDRLDDLPADDLGRQLDELIEKQRRTIVELELARDALADLDS